MRFATLLFVFSCVLVSAQERFSTRALTSQGYITREYWAGEIIAKPKGYAGVSAKTETRSALAEAVVDALGYAYIPHTGDVASLTARATAMSANPDFESVSLSPVAKADQAPQPVNDPAFWLQWGLGNSLPAGSSWKPSTKRFDNLYIGSFDTGACFGHEDFDWSRNEVKLNYNAILAPKSPEALPFDDNGHGCATTGIVAAKSNNRLGISGMADNVKTAYIKVLDAKGNGKVKDIVSGILEYATRVKNMPAGSRFLAIMAFGFEEQVPPIEEAVQIARKAGIMFFASAGNEGWDLSRFKKTPATTDGVISVAACTPQNELVVKTFWASNYGNPVLGCAAGVEVWTTVPKPTESSSYELADPSGYKMLEGTSFAVSFYAGAAAQLINEKPDISEEEIRIRLMNGNRKVAPATIWKRSYQGPDLFVSGSSLYLPTALAEDNQAPAQPVLEITPGHSSARIRLSDTERPFGIRCAYGNIGDQQILELVPYFGNEDIILKNQDGTPLPSSTDLQVACKMVDGAGNWSPLSRGASFHTKESKSEAVSLNLFNASLGPLGDIIAQADPNTRPLWSPKEFPLLGQMTWYAGTQALNYRVGDNDSVLVSEPIALPEGSVSINLRQFVQMIGTRAQGMHFDSSELSVLWQEDGQERQKVLRQIMPNSKEFGLEAFQLDVTEFAGKTVRLQFRLFTNGSSVGIGWIVGAVEVRSDK